MTIQRYEQGLPGNMSKYEDGGWVKWTDSREELVSVMQREREVREKLVAALNAALERIAHRSDCGIIRPSEEWAEHGSVSFEHCTCEVQQVKSALAAAKEIDND